MCAEGDLQPVLQASSAVHEVMSPHASFPQRGQAVRCTFVPLEMTMRGHDSSTTEGGSGPDWQPPCRREPKLRAKRLSSTTPLARNDELHRLQIAQIRRHQITAICDQSHLHS